MVKVPLKNIFLDMSCFPKSLTEYLTKEEQQQLFNSFNKEFGTSNIGDFEEQLT